MHKVGNVSICVFIIDMLPDCDPSMARYFCYYTYFHIHKDKKEKYTVTVKHLRQP